MVEDDVKYILRVIEENLEIINRNPSSIKSVLTRILENVYDRGYQNGIMKFAEGMVDKDNICQDDGK